MSLIVLIHIVGSIVTCFGQLTWNVIDPLPTGYANLATGYDANTASLWIIGGMRYTGSTQWSHKVIQYNMSHHNNSSPFTHYTDFPTNGGTYGARFIGQIYTQINNSIWFIIAQSFGIFSMDDQTVTYPYTNNLTSVTTPLWTYDKNGIWPDQACLTSYQSKYLIVVGGDSNGDSASVTRGKQFQIYNIETNTWSDSNSSLPSLSTSRSYFCCQVVNEYLYAIGGTKNNEITDTIEKIYLGDMWNIQNEEWHSLTATLTERKYRIRCATIGNDIYVVGGMDNNLNAVSTVDKINTMNDMVSKDSDISVARFDVGLVAVGRLLYVIGGSDQIAGDYVSDVFEYSFKEFTPSPTATPSTSPTNPTHNPTQMPSETTNSPSKAPTKMPTREANDSEVSCIGIIANIFVTILFAFV